MDVVRSTSSMARLSVISRQSCDGSMAVARSAPSDVVDQGGLLELAGRQVHPDLERHAELLAATSSPDGTPAPGPSARCGGWCRCPRRALMNWAGMQDAVVGVVPAHQCLGTDDPPVVEGHERLVVDLHLAAVDATWCSAVSRSSQPSERAPIRSASNMANWPPRPRSLARYMATSASWSRSSRDFPVLAQRDADAHGGDHLVPGAQRDRVAEGVEDGVRHLRWRHRPR